MHWNERYPIGRLLAERTAALGLDRNDLVRALGYRNPARGRRRLDALLEGREEAPGLRARLAEALGLPPEGLDVAFAESRRELAAEQEAVARWAFRPSLTVDTDGRGPKAPLFIRAWAWPEERVIELPADFRGWDVRRQVRYVGRRARWHFRQASGQTHWFGAITGYRLRRTFDQTLRFDTAGRLLDELGAASPPEPPRLCVGGRPVPPRLLRSAPG